MRLFRKNIPQAKLAASDKAAGWIANAILKLQKKFANTMDGISATWKTKQQWIFLYMVCFVFGGLSVVAIIHPFNKQNDLLKPSAIKVPRNIHSENPSIRITENEFRQVQDFKKSLDSSTKKKLLEERPGLIDSLEMVEQLYYSQKK